MLNIPVLVTLFTYVAANPGFVQLPLSVKRYDSTHAESALRKRAEDLPVPLINDLLFYDVDIYLGTPPVFLQVQIDTGSSDLWVYGPKALGTGGLYYDPSESSTAKYINSDFDILYVDNTTFKGDYYTDKLVVNEVETTLQFAVVNEPYNGVSVFGIGSRNGEQGGHYPNYPVALKQQGLIESTAFSLYLDNQTADFGSLLFGGVDTSKYSGQLYTVPIRNYRAFVVDFEFEGVKMNGTLDSGTSGVYLPDDLANSIASRLGGVWDDKLGVYHVHKPSDFDLTFSFSGANITVPSSALISEVGGSQTLIVGRSSFTSGLVILGDAFLRSAYVVYDLDNNQIAIAQANYNGKGPVLPITSAGIPNAEPAPEL